MAGSPTATLGPPVDLPPMEHWAGPFAIATATRGRCDVADGQQQLEQEEQWSACKQQQQGSCTSPARAQPKRWHVGRLNRVDRLFGPARMLCVGQVHGFWTAGGTGESVLLSDDEVKTAVGEIAILLPPLRRSNVRGGASKMAELWPTARSGRCRKSARSSAGPAAC